MAYRMKGVRGVTDLIVYLADEVPTLSFSVPTAIPRHVNANDIYQYPVFLSTNKTAAREWRFFSVAQSPFAFTVPVPYGRVEYIMMNTPAGVVYAYGLNDDGSFYLEEWDNGVPTQRRLTTTVLHKGDLVFVADNRQNTPRRGD